jgi:hypothetical protein
MGLTIISSIPSSRTRCPAKGEALPRKEVLPSSEGLPASEARPSNEELINSSLRCARTRWELDRLRDSFSDPAPPRKF